MAAGSFLVILQPCRSALVSCEDSPNCTKLHRVDCDRRAAVPNSCGDCEPGYVGLRGPTNMPCVANRSCALVYPGQVGCPAAEHPNRPFVVPYGDCVCDQGGRHWKTAPDWCSSLKLNTNGLFELKLCRSCNGGDGVECIPLATWSADKSFDCATRGADSFIFRDGCPESWDPTDICGHPALTVEFNRRADGCLLSPKCPESVLPSNLAESCCFGTYLSHPLTEWSYNPEEHAPGFCGGPPPHEQGKCGVLVKAPGWSGCHCLNPFRSDQRACTIECTPPDCPLPEEGLRPTPNSWLTSEVPGHLRPPDRSRTEWLQQQDTSDSSYASPSAFTTSAVGKLLSLAVTIWCAGPLFMD